MKMPHENLGLINIKLREGFPEALQKALQKNAKKRENYSKQPGHRHNGVCKVFV